MPDFGYREIGADFQPLHVDFGQPGGELFRPPNGAIDFNLGNSPDALSDLTAEAMSKQQAAAEARNFVDSLYQQNPSLRDVPISVDSDVLGAESFDEFTQNLGMKSARPIDELPPDLSDVYSGKPSTNHGFNRPSSAGDAVIDVSARPVASSLDDVARAGGAIPRAARLLGNPATQGVIDLGVGIAGGDSLPRAAVGALGATGGGVAGAHIGGALGAGFGSIIPILGTAGGAVIGAALGGWLGGQLGGDSFRNAFDALFPNATDEQRNGLSPTPGSVPFTGGQSPGVLYDVTVTIETAIPGGVPIAPESYTSRVPGPIRSVFTRDVPAAMGGFHRYIMLRSGLPNEVQVRVYYMGGNSYNQVDVVDVSVSRADNLPDLSGNPPAIPTTPIAPGNPLLNNPNNSPYNDYFPATAQPQATPRGDSPYHPPAGRLAPGQTSPEQRPPVSTPPRLKTPKTPRNPNNPQQALDPPGKPANAPKSPGLGLSLPPDPELGWGGSPFRGMGAGGSATGTSIGTGTGTGTPPGTGTGTGTPPGTGTGTPPGTGTGTPPGTGTGRPPTTGSGTGTITLPPEIPDLTGSDTTPEPPVTRPPGTGTTEDDCKNQCSCKGESKPDKNEECDPCDLLQQIKDALLQEITLKLSYQSCDAEKPEERIIKAPRIHAIAQTIEYKDIYDEKRGHHACEVSTAIPESWAWKVGEIPQLVVQFAEDVKPGKSSRWSITIPHYQFGSSYQPNIPKYIRGNCMGTLILNDNSQLVLNCKDKLEWFKFLDKIKPLIDPLYLASSRTKITDRGGQTIEQKRVKPVYGKFFATGQKNLVPDWIIRF